MLDQCNFHGMLADASCPFMLCMFCIRAIEATLYGMESTEAIKFGNVPRFQQRPAPIALWCKFHQNDEHDTHDCPDPIEAVERKLFRQLK